MKRKQFSEEQIERDLLCVEGEVRGRVVSSGRTARACGIARAGQMMATCGRVCASRRSSVGGSAIGGCTSCSAATASRSTVWIGVQKGPLGGVIGVQKGPLISMV